MVLVDYREPSAGPGHSLGPSGWRPLAIMGGGIAVALALTPWAVLRTGGLDMSGHMLVTAQLMLGVVTLLLVARSAEQASSAGGAGLAVVLLAVGAACFTALTGSVQVQAFSLNPADVLAFQGVQRLIMASAGLAAVFGLVGVVRYGGERRQLELAVVAQCALVALSAATWSPMADLTHPMQPALMAAV